MPLRFTSAISPRRRDSWCGSWTCASCPWRAYCISSLVSVSFKIDQPSPGALNGVLVRSDLDRTNLGNARLQGLPKDVLHGDPTGVLFDWVNSAFFFSYVSRFLLQFWLHSSLGPPDSLPSPCYGPIQALPSSHLARMCSGRMGPLLCAYGAYTYPVLCFRVVLSHNIVDVVQLCRALCRACWTGRV